jgi:hypothetical protein
VDFLKARFEGRPLGLIVPFGAPAVKFAAQYRDRLFPGTPIVFAGVEPRLVPPDVLRTNATLVTQKVNLPGMVEDILQMRPDTTSIVVVFGASQKDKDTHHRAVRMPDMFLSTPSLSVARAKKRHRVFMGSTELAHEGGDGAVRDAR